MKKGWVIGCSIAGGVGLVLLLCGGAMVLMFGSLFSAIQSVGKPADDFLAMLGNGDTTGAYQAGASGLRAAETPEQFADFVKRSRLDQYRSSNWNKFNIVNSQGTVEGTVTLKDGSVVPLKVNLVNEGGWKVLGLELTGGAGTGVTPAVPSDAEARRLVNRDAGEFRRAVEAEDFTRFHASVSKKLQRESTAEQFAEAFAEVVALKPALAGVEPRNLTITKPAAMINDEVLGVEVEYVGDRMPVRFRMQYVKEGGEWRLSFIHVNVLPG